MTFTSTLISSFEFDSYLDNDDNDNDELSIISSQDLFDLFPSAAAAAEETSPQANDNTFAAPAPSATSTTTAQRNEAHCIVKKKASSASAGGHHSHDHYHGLNPPPLGSLQSMLLKTMRGGGMFRKRLHDAVRPQQQPAQTGRAEAVHLGRRCAPPQCSPRPAKKARHQHSFNQAHRATTTSGPGNDCGKSIIKQEQYTYPLNVAIQDKGLSSDLLAKFVRTSPASLLSMRDGRQLETPLQVLLRHRPRDLATVDWMLLHNPESACVRDRHLNTPLHVACCHFWSLDVIRHLYILYPEAARMRNFHGHTPLDLLQRRTASNSSESAVDFLYEKL